MLALLAPKAGERILDVGCGTGQLTKAIAESGASVVGIDKSPEMIESAQSNYPGIQFRVADAADFSFAEPFDSVFSNAALHWVTRAESAVECIATALKPGGRFVAEFGGKDNAGNIARAIQQTLKERLQVEVNHDWYFPSIGEYTSLLEKHGLEVSSAWLFDRPTPLEGESGLRSWIEMFCGSMIKDVPETVRENILGEVEAKLRGTNYQDNVWFVDYRRLRITATKKA